MVEKLEECIEMFGKDVSKSVTYPATKKLFEVREDSEKLSDKKGGLFQLVVEKLLFIMKRYRPELETAVGLLNTRVSKSEVDDWKKLRRILRFVHCTLKEKRCFGATSLDEIFKWVDESYAVYNEMKS